MQSNAATLIPKGLIERKPIPRRGSQACMEKSTARPSCEWLKDEVEIFITTLESCLAGCPCAAALVRKSKWILAECDKLETSRLQATSQLLEEQDIFSRLSSCCVLALKWASRLIRLARRAGKVSNTTTGVNQQVLGNTTLSRQSQYWLAEKGSLSTSL